MKIGIDASRAFIDNRTGIEEYSFRVIEQLTKEKSLKEHEVILYARGGKLRLELEAGNFRLPYNWKVKEVLPSRFWTQLGLSLELLLNPIDALFVPAHTVPLVHPKNTVVTVHGLEYEHCPESYGLYSRWFHRFFVKKSCKWASKIIAISKNTRKDLLEIYKADKKKIEIVYNGFLRIDDNFKKIRPKKLKAQDERFIFFVSRLEERKNIMGILEAFKILKSEHSYPGKLVMAGKPGRGYEKFKAKVKEYKLQREVVETGFVSEEEKWWLMENTEIFMFPSLSEGFGFPVVEAQNVGTPVVTSDIGPLDEVAGNDEILVDPNDPEEIAKIANKIATEKTFKESVIEKGTKNVKRFSWERCGGEVARVILKK